MARPKKVIRPEPKKRGKRGEGSVWQGQDGRWRWAVTIEGKRITSTEPTQENARQQLEVVKAKAREPQAEEAPETNPTLGDYLDGWLRDMVDPYLTPNSATNYRQMVQQHIKPALGEKRLHELTREDVQRLINEVAKKTSRRSGQPLAPKTVKGVHGVLSVALNQAVEYKRVEENVAAKPRLPKRKKPEIFPLDESEVARFLAAARSDRYAVAFAIAVLLGLRKTEILNLEWRDFDLKTRRLHVRGTKTPSSNRHILLTPDLVAPLRSHRVAWEQQRAALGDGWTAGDRLFAGGEGKPAAPRTFYRHFERTLKAAGLRHIRFHDLRHTAASLRLQRLEPIASVAKLLGHASPSLTASVYAHVIAGMAEAAADRMDGFLGGFMPDSER